MPKDKEDSKGFFHRMLGEFPGQFRTDGRVLFCLMCDVEINAKQKSQVSQHLATSKHVTSSNRKNKGQEPQKNQLLLTTMKGNNDEDRSVNVFAMNLTKCFIKSNIPLHTIRKPSMIQFLEKHTKYSVPSEPTLHNKYIPQIYDECMKKLMEKAEKNPFLWVSLDESTDSIYLLKFLS